MNEKIGSIVKLELQGKVGSSAINSTYLYFKCFASASEDDHKTTVSGRLHRLDGCVDIISGTGNLGSIN
ncbi:hypothetical protein SDJN02_15540, partial [Cucurbita argyrosperma subsp. argyrosperma]